MNPDESQNGEQDFFDELLAHSLLNDSVCEQHQQDLRVKVLQAFDSVHRDTIVRAPVVTMNRNSAQVIGVVAALTACLLGIISLQHVNDSGPIIRPVVEFQPDARVSADPVFVAALASAEALREEHSIDLFFDALAICEQINKAKLLDADASQMRLYNESSRFPTPVETPKG